MVPTLINVSALSEARFPAPCTADNFKAMAIDQALSEAHVSLAFVKADYTWEWSGAEKGFQRAIALNPNHASAHQWYGYALWRTGKFEESIAEPWNSIHSHSP